MIRPFYTKDKNKLIDLLKLNIPHYFAPSEESDFMEYLDHHADHYFVVEENGRVIGCGGYNYFDNQTKARISWDIIHPDFQGKGIGKKLTLFRINEIKKNNAVNFIIVRTSQLVFRFYEKLGFELVKTEKGFWAKGFDLYEMKMELHKT